MNQNWKQTLASHGAVLVDGAVADFGDAATEREAARAGSILADLSHLGVLEFSGLDAQAFLHGQLSCDVSSMMVGASACGGYCSPKGRLLADFRLWRSASVFRMVLARSIVEPIRKRLALYVLRSKVQIADRSDDLVLVGAAGKEAGPAVRSLFGRLPDGTLTMLSDDTYGDLIALADGRYLICARADAAPGLWGELAGTLTPAGTPCWEWLDVRNGFPWITTATQDQFVPQMVSLELLGGVNFHKGCYPGQEIVARTQYLGKPKRRLFLASAVTERLPAPGSELYSDDPQDQAAGMVVNAARSPEGGVDLLAVVFVESRERSGVHLDSPGGPVLRFLELPYAAS